MHFSDEMLQKQEVQTNFYYNYLASMVFGYGDFYFL